MIILVGSQNAGTGKSTLVTNLAVLFSIADSKKGYKIIMVGVDKQCTSIDWYTLRRKIKTSLKKEKQIITISPSDMYDNLTRQLVEWNINYNRVIVDFPAGLSPEFEAALLVTDMVVFPFRPLKEDLNTLPAIVEAVKKANRKNPELLACAAIMTCSDIPELDETQIEELFAKHTDTISLLKPIIHYNEVYQQALSKGYGVVDLEEEDATKEINALRDALKDSYNKKRKSHKQITAIEPSEIDDGSSQEQQLESVPSIPADEFLSNPDDFSPEKFADGLKDISDDELVERYKDLSLQHVRMDIQFQMMQGLIILEAKRRYPSNQEFGKWVKSVQTLCLHRQPVRNRYMHLAEFFHDKPMGLISLTAAYEISAPINADVAKAVYEIAKDKKLSVAKVKKLIADKKSESGIKTESNTPNTTDHVKKVLRQVKGFGLTREQQIKFFKQCISELKEQADDVIDAKSSGGER